MRQETVNVYQYDELSDDAKEKARQWWLSVDDSESINEMVDIVIVPALETIGFNNPKVFYCISYCQGDGACFTASSIDTDTFIRFCLGRLDTTTVDWLFKTCWQNFDNHRLDWLQSVGVLDEYSLSVSRSIGSNFYSHEGTATIDCCGGYNVPESIDKVVDEFVETANELRRELSQAIFAALLKEYEFQTSDDIVAENIVANEYEFDEFGNRW